MNEPARNPAPRGGDPDAGRLLDLGPVLLVRFSALLRTARTYDVTNQAFRRQLQEFMLVLQQTMEEEDEVALAAVADSLYLNGVRLKANASLLGVYHGLIEEFERRALGGVRFLQGVPPAEAERFLQLFMAAEDPAMAERFGDAVAEAGIAHIVPVPAADLDKDEIARSLDESADSTGERGRARRVFWRAVLGTKRIVVRAAQTGRPDLRQAKRLVQPVVDSIMKNEYSIVGMTALKEHDEYTYAHCVNVSVLSVSMGQALGLDRQALADLGVAGLLHDIGKVAVPGDVLRKPDRLSNDEWNVIQRHPLEGVKMMFRMPGITGLTLDCMRVSLEHHLNFDLTGYPEFGHEWAQSTMTRVVALADCFDAMTAHRSYHVRARTPFEGLQYLLGPTRVQFDPAVLWALVRTIGLYPAGSVLLTRSNHVVLAVSPNPGDLRRPFCRVLVRPDGTEVPEDADETWDPMPATESVLRVLRPEEIAVDTQELLAA